MHLTFNPPVPTFPDDIFAGEPDVNGSVKNQVNILFRKAVTTFGQQPDVTDPKGRTQSPRKYANHYLASYQNRDQVADIGAFFDLDSDQADAVSHGTNPIRFINVISLPAMAADNTPAAEGGTAYPGPNLPGSAGVTFADPLSLWNKKCAEFQHNLNVGADGSVPLPPK
jgi:hypothetical protein